MGGGQGPGASSSASNRVKLFSATLVSIGRQGSGRWRLSRPPVTTGFSGLTDRLQRPWVAAVGRP